MKSMGTGFGLDVVRADPVDCPAEGRQWSASAVVVARAWALRARPAPGHNLCNGGSVHDSSRPSTSSQRACSSAASRTKFFASTSRCWLLLLGVVVMLALGAYDVHQGVTLSLATAIQDPTNSQRLRPVRILYIQILPQTLCNSASLDRGSRRKSATLTLRGETSSELFPFLRPFFRQGRSAERTTRGLCQFV